MTVLLRSSAVTLLGLLVLALPATAHAMCASAEPFVSPADGTSLPPDPVVFLFVPEGLYGSDIVEMSIDVESGGEGVTHSDELVSHNPSFTTYRIAVAARAPMEVRVRASFQIRGYPLRTFETKYRIADSAGQDVNAGPLLAKPEYESSRWTCSYQSTWNLKPSVDAPAYRIEWAQSLEAYQAGQRSSVVLPSHVRRFWTDDRRPLGPPKVELGHLDCMDMTLVWPGERIWAGVWALRPDGSEVPLTDEPIPLSKPHEG